MNLLVSKICAAILLAVLRLVAGLLPLKVYRKLNKWGRRGDKVDDQNKRKKRIDLCLSIFLCFGAGLLLSTCFIHMIPEVFSPTPSLLSSLQFFFLFSHNKYPISVA